MKKTSKKILSLFLSAVMVVTMLPTVVLSAFGATSSGAYYHSGSSLSGGVTVSSYVGFASSNGYVIDFDYNPGSGTTDNQTVFDIGNKGGSADDVTREDFEVLENGFHYVWTDTAAYYDYWGDPFGGKLQANTTSKIKIEIYPNGDGDTINFYVDGALATTHDTTGVSNIASHSVHEYFALNHSVNFGVGCGYWGTATEGEIADFLVADVNYNTLNYGTDDLQSIIADYETTMSAGYVFTNMESAYSAYVNACKVYDAYVYGNNADADVNRAYVALKGTTDNMTMWKATTSIVSQQTSFSGDSSGYDSTKETYNKNLLYVETSSDVCSMSQTNNSSSSIIVTLQYSPKTVMFYDGENDCMLPVLFYAQKNVSKTRTVFTVYPTNGNAGKGLTDNDNTEIYLIGKTSGSSTSSNDWRGASGKTRNWTWSINQTTTYVGSQADVSFGSTKNQRWSVALGQNDSDRVDYASALKVDNSAIDFSGKAYKDFQLQWQFYGGSTTSGVTNWNTDIYDYATSSAHIYVLNYKGIKEAINNNISKYSNVKNYRTGGLQTILSAYDVLTQDVTSIDFGSGTTTILDSYNTAISNIATTATADENPDGYQALRDALDYEGEVADGNTYVVKELGEMDNSSFKEESWETFQSAYKTAKGIMADTSKLYTQGTEANTAATALLNAFNGLEKSSRELVAPSMSAEEGTYIGASDTITITNNDENDGSVVKIYVGKGDNDGNVDYNEVGEFDTAKQSTFDVAPFEKLNDADADVVYVKATVVNAKEGSATLTLDTVVTYNLLKAPTFTVNDGDVIDKDKTIELFPACGAKNVTYQYSYNNGNDWNDGGSFTPFADLSKNFVVTIQARVQCGGYTSAVTQITVYRDQTFDAYVKLSDGTISNTSFDDGSTIYIKDTENYNNESLYYILTIDGSIYAGGKYNTDNGLSIPDGSYVASVVAYSADENNALAKYKVAQATFVKGDYDTLVYHESFDGATIDGTTFTTGSDNEKGVNGTLSVSGTAQILDGYCSSGVDGNGNSADYRENVIDISASTSNSNKNTITLSSNPLTSNVSSTVAKSQGVTISFWRAYNTDDVTSGSDWTQAFTFAKSSDYDNGRGQYYYFEINGTSISSFNNGDGNGVSGSYYDFIPENQDPTLHAAGNNRREWVHVAVTIDPTAGVTVYTNGEPHEVAKIQCGGDYADGVNDAELAQDIIDFITASDTEIRLADGDPYNCAYYDTYLDDIRIYTNSLTQVEINNLYADGEDGNTADVYSVSSTGHDPTAVTVYTLAGGTYTSTDGTTITEAAGKTVGQEFIDYYGIKANDTTQITQIDYYIFGTGMTIYHSTDNVKWEVVGDSAGRCGYQNQTLFGGVYTETLKKQLAYARVTENNIAQGGGYLQWAPHIMYNLNADCWQYYGSTSSWGYSESCIFTGNSQSIVGPYKDITTVYASKSDCDTTPANAIDSCVYYGHNSDGSINPNQLYMLYGSWWSSIYVTKLDPTTGQSKYLNEATDPYGENYGTGVVEGSDGEEGYHTYGKLLYQCNPESVATGSGEGGYVVYQSGYYYFYVSLGSNYGNYNLRVFRSQYPDKGFETYYGDSADSTTVNTCHGMSFLSSYYLPIYDYVYTSIGHNSVYKVVNNAGKILTVDSVHARPYSTNSATNGLVGMQDGALITRQSDLTGNISIQNMIAYTQDGWQVAFPLQYNGTDTTAHRYTAYDIEGVYTFNDLLTSADYNYAKPQSLTIKAISQTEAVVYTNDSEGSVSQKMTLTYGTDYAGDRITYFTTTGSGGTYQGVFGEQTIDGETVTEFSYFGENWHCFTWGYRTEKLPSVDLESAGDIVQQSGVIYTHLKDDTFAKYGNEISDDYLFATDNYHQGERCTTMTTTYPYTISTTDSAAVYCLNDDDFVEKGFTGSSIKASDPYGYWVDESGNQYSDAEAQTAYEADNSIVLTKTYVLTGSVSTYFNYGNGDDGEYPETGVELAIRYTNCITNDTYGEYEFLYVEPNPAAAHTMVALRNQDNNMHFAATTFNRFLSSYGSITTVDGDSTTGKYLSNLTSNNSGNISNYTAGPTLGVGSFNFLSNFGTSNADSVKDGIYDTPALIASQFSFYDSTVGINSGAYAAAEHDDCGKDASGYAKAIHNIASYVVNADYYIDYSNTEDLLINRDSSGNPTGYTLTFQVSNFNWNPKNEDNLSATTNYCRNSTGLTASATVDRISSDHQSSNTSAYTFANNRSADNNVTNNDNATTLSWSNCSFGRRALSSDWATGCSNASDAYDTSVFDNSTVNYYLNGLWSPFSTIENGYADSGTFSGRISLVGTGFQNVTKASGTQDSSDITYAEANSNFLFEKGVIGIKSTWTNDYYSGEEVYSYYNVGVSTCDKGAVREFVETFCNKQMKITYDSDGKITAFEAGDDIESGNYTIASYREYLDAVAEAYYFLENPKNTTYTSYVDENGNTVECEETAYSTAYGTTPENGKHAYIYSNETGTDIFGDSGAYTDPIQAKIIQDIIEAYENLFTIEDYTESETLYTEAVDEVTNMLDKDNTDGYTSTSVDAWNGFVERIENYYNYYTDASQAEEGQDYWRNVELTGDEYKELNAVIENIQNSLMPKVENEELESTITTKDTERNTGIFTGDNQQYSYNSWLALTQEIDTAQTLYDSTVEPSDGGTGTAEKDADGFYPGKYAVTGTESYTYNGKTYYYQVYDENTLSDLQVSVNTETSTLDETKLKSIDSVEAYDAFDSAYKVINTVAKAKYNSTAVDAIKQSLASNNACVYATVTEEQAKVYNSYVSTSISAGDVIKKTSETETDPYTAALLTLINEINAQPELYQNKFTANFTVKAGDDVLSSSTDTQYYGGTFTFDAGTYSGYNLATWQITNDDTKSTQTLSSSVGTSIQRIADANITVVVNLAKDDSASNTYTYKILDAQGNPIDYAYSNTLYTSDNISDLGNDVINNYSIPFYTCTGWDVSDAVDGVITVKAKISVNPYTITVTDGVLNNESGNTENSFVFDKAVTINYTGANTFVAWAVKKSDSSYQVASYSQNYKFYVAADENFVPITSTTTDGATSYFVDGNPVTADIIESSVQNDTGSISADDYVAQKLANKAPFVSIITVRKENDNTKVRAYVRVTEGSTSPTAYGVIFTKGNTLNDTTTNYTRYSNNMLDSGQFSYTLSSKSAISYNISFKAFVNYDFTYTVNGTTNTEIGSTSADISALDYSNVYSA